MTAFIKPYQGSNKYFRFDLQYIIRGEVTMEKYVIIGKIGWITIRRESSNAADRWIHSNSNSADDNDKGKVPQIIWKKDGNEYYWKDYEFIL